jgi:hypothetical protein
MFARAELSVSKTSEILNWMAIFRVNYLPSNATLSSTNLIMTRIYKLQKCFELSQIKFRRYFGWNISHVSTCVVVILKLLIYCHCETTPFFKRKKKKNIN